MDAIDAIDAGHVHFGAAEVVAGVEEREGVLLCRDPLCVSCSAHHRHMRSAAPPLSSKWAHIAALTRAAAIPSRTNGIPFLFGQGIDERIVLVDGGRQRGRISIFQMLALTDVVERNTRSAVDRYARFLHYAMANEHDVRQMAWEAALRKDARLRAQQLFRTPWGDDCESAAGAALARGVARANALARMGAPEGTINDEITTAVEAARRTHDGWRLDEWPVFPWSEGAFANAIRSHLGHELCDAPNAQERGGSGKRWHFDDTITAPELVENDVRVVAALPHALIPERAWMRDDPFLTEERRTGLVMNPCRWKKYRASRPAERLVVDDEAPPHTELGGIPTLPRTESMRRDGETIIDAADLNDGEMERGSASPWIDATGELRGTSPSEGDSDDGDDRDMWTRGLADHADDLDKSDRHRFNKRLAREVDQGVSAAADLSAELAQWLKDRVPRPVVAAGWERFSLRHGTDRYLSLAGWCSTTSDVVNDRQWHRSQRWPRRPARVRARVIGRSSS